MAAPASSFGGILAAVGLFTLPFQFAALLEAASKTAL